VQWWGINSLRYPVWASLSRDFLSVMATSVSSEKALLSAGISKRRTLLKAAQVWSPVSRRVDSEDDVGFVGRAGSLT
jgi:hypothetical protein